MAGISLTNRKQVLDALDGKYGKLMQKYVLQAVQKKNLKAFAQAEKEGRNGFADENVDDYHARLFTDNDILGYNTLTGDEAFPDGEPVVVTPQSNPSRDTSKDKPAQTQRVEATPATPQKSKRDLAREAITLWRKGDKESRAMANKIWSENFTKEELAQMAQRAKANKATQEHKQRVADEATDAEKKVNLAKEMGALDKELANVQAPEPIEQTADRALRSAVEGSAPRMSERKPVIDFAELEARGYITPREDDKKSIFEGKKLSEKEMDELMTDIQDNAKTPKDLEPYYGIVDKGFLDELKNNMLNSQDN